MIRFILGGLLVAMLVVGATAKTVGSVGEAGATGFRALSLSGAESPASSFRAL